MDTDTRISVIAGRPGAGKTRWAAREVVETLRDVNNVVIYIGFCWRTVRKSTGDSQ